MRYFPIVIVLSLGSLLAQAPGANPVADETRAAWRGLRANLLATAERMPEEFYSFQPTPQVETFARRVAHIANGNYGTCTGLEGEGKSLGAQDRKTKAELIAALKASYEVCDRVLNALTDANAMEMVDSWLAVPPRRGPKRSRIGQVDGLLRHCAELYGYMAVYLRLKNVVPPTTQP
jgi:hypothetical protein